MARLATFLSLFLLSGAAGHAFAQAPTPPTESPCAADSASAACAALQGRISAAIQKSRPANDEAAKLSGAINAAASPASRGPFAPGVQIEASDAAVDGALAKADAEAAKRAAAQNAAEEKAAAYSHIGTRIAYDWKHGDWFALARAILGPLIGTLVVLGVLVGLGQWLVELAGSRRKSS